MPGGNDHVPFLTRVYYAAFVILLASISIMSMAIAYMLFAFGHTFLTFAGDVHNISVTLDTYEIEAAQ